MAASVLRLVVAINPAAAFGASREVGPRAVERLRAAGHTVTALLEPDFASLQAAAAAALAGDADALVVVGGDGMVSLGVGLVATTGVPLGIVPSGTGNDMARGLGIPIGDADAAIGALLAALGRTPRTIDVGVARGAGGDIRYFVSVFSGGFDAAVNERANRMRRPRGKSRYTLAILRELVTLRPIRYRLTLDGVEESRSAILVAVANNVSFGGGMRVAPDALLDDGLFDVVTLDPVGRVGLLRIFPTVFAGTHIRDPRVTVRRASRVRIESPGVVAYADGERVGPLPIDLEMLPRALAVLA
ncbi:MAG: diacylglycerol kinase [Burkholderiaceae bacterium]|nr:diacylglycerol kinase [Microbacteriaceae bacterium]